MPRITFTAESIESTRKVVDEGMYWVKLTGFSPKTSKKGDSINFNPNMELTRNADGTPAPRKDDGKAVPIFYNLNSQIPNFINDFCHGFGLPMETLPNGGLQIPGIWIPESEDDISKCEYKGPLVGREGQVYLIKTDYQGTPQNKIKYFVCAIPNCNQKYPKVKHSTDLS